MPDVPSAENTRIKLADVGRLDSRKIVGGNVTDCATCSRFDADWRISANIHCMALRST